MRPKAGEATKAEKITLLSGLGVLSDEAIARILRCHPAYVRAATRRQKKKKSKMTTPTHAGKDAIYSRKSAEK